MKDKFNKILEKTGYIHMPLPLPYDKSLEAEIEKKEVLKKYSLKNSLSPESAYHSGKGSIDFIKADAIRMSAPVIFDKWPAGTPLDGDYCNFGTVCLNIVPDLEDWTEYNRLSFYVKPEGEGVRSVHIKIGLVNEGAEKVPDKYWRNGCHVINLINNRWN
ncbi:MAG: hypothetical protein K0S55_2088, partial [Clostridia bacterium]|nr:hypothetical protein [Clostridia bacterium]